MKEGNTALRKNCSFELEEIEWLNCKLYKMGKPRVVPYKDCGSSYDEGWLDDICTQNRDDEV